MVFFDCDSHSSKIINISGEWAFYDGKFLSANEMNMIEHAVKQYVEIPSSWRKYKTNGKILPAFGIATYYLKVILKNNSKGKAYGINTGNITCAYNLYVNDELLIKSGNPTTSAVGYVPMWGPKVCHFIPKSDTIQIVLHVSNFLDPVNAGIIQPIHFGTQRAIEQYVIKRNLISVFILSSFIILFLFQLFVSFVHQEDPSHFVIALLVLCFFLNVITNGEVLLMQLFPNFDAVLEYRLWLLSYFCIPLLFKLVALNFPSDINRSLERWVFIFYAIVFMLVFAFNLSWILKYIYYVIFPTMAIVTYLVVVLIRAVLRKRNYSVLFFTSFILMILLLLNDLLYMADRITAGYYSQFGVLIFVVIQSVITFHKFADSHKKALIISEDLRISKVNLELIVEAKTEALCKANEEYETANHIQDYLISSISHDIIGIFNTLLAVTKKLIKEPGLTKEQYDLSKKTHETVEDGYIMLEDMLGWARLKLLNDSRQKPIRNLSEIVEKNIRFYKDSIERKFITVETVINNDLIFQCDDYHLNTIIRRLLSNAIKYSCQNGLIRISNAVDHDFITVSVCDQGIGIPDNMMELIFKPDSEKIRSGTAGEQGNGLGLIIAKELTESNKGEIFCFNSKPWTSFVLKFPVG
ncbi:MAG: sensor histidine kinase [Bacteroidales bacterium]|nr:sensor histidine kinase [Bacteroidales bacterium]MDD3907321.1 sensor histidine kinase [Bacteroidales bacterium]MDD4713031.1 sensor histidine kinase [Bacteroidales bacterium]